MQKIFLSLAVLVVSMTAVQAENIVLDGQLCELVRQPVSEVAKTHPGARVQSFECDGFKGTVVFPTMVYGDAPTCHQQTTAEPKVLPPPRLTGHIITYQGKSVELVEAPLARVKASRPDDLMEAFQTDVGDFTIVLPKPAPVAVKTPTVIKPPVAKPALPLCELLTDPVVAHRPPVILEEPTPVAYELPWRRPLPKLPDACEFIEPVKLPEKVAPKPVLPRLHTVMLDGTPVDIIYGSLDEVRKEVGDKAQLTPVTSDNKAGFMLRSDRPTSPSVQWQPSTYEPVLTSYIAPVVPCQPGGG